MNWIVNFVLILFSHLFSKSLSIFFLAVLASGILSCSSAGDRKGSNRSGGIVNFDRMNPDSNRQPSAEAYRSEYIFDWPVNRARLTRGYMPAERRPHMGIDLAGPKGTPIYSAHQGMVIYAGRDFRGFGNMILIESGAGWATLYAHLNKILVSEGQKVKLGEFIAHMGNTGHSTGSHLHFEIRKNKGPVDPLMYLPGGAEAARKLAKK